jgi:hypothetical protein
MPGSESGHSRRGFVAVGLRQSCAPEVLPEDTLSVSEAAMPESPSTASSTAFFDSGQSLSLTSTVGFCNALTTLPVDPSAFFLSSVKSKLRLSLWCVGLSVVMGLWPWVSGAWVFLWLGVCRRGSPVQLWVCRHGSCGHGLRRGSYFGCWLGLFADLILFCPNKLDDVSSYGWML